MIKLILFILLVVKNKIDSPNPTNVYNLHFQEIHFNKLMKKLKSLPYLIIH